ncbi:MAG: uroporphyrinogen decarboxylase family protein [Planctomycetota bacterium]
MSNHPSGTRIALDTIHLRPTSRWGHTEFSLNYRPDYLAARAGCPAGSPDFRRAYQDRFKLDLLWYTHDGLIDWAEAGRTTDMGHAAYAADGSDRRDAAACPFASMEEVWQFDAVAEYGLPDFDEQVRAYEAQIQQARRDCPDQLTPGGYYRTLISGAIATFGWDMLLMAASDPVKMERVFDSFFRRTLFHMRAWAATSAEVIIQHDDFVWAGGPFMNPEIYREVLIPRYAELWKPLHEAGKKVLFCSDGDFTAFTGDVAEAGADGFIFEPCMDFGRMVDDFGPTHCLVGSFVDCRDLTLGKWDTVRADIDRTFDRLADCRGAIVVVGNHLPPNIPDTMLDAYFDALLPRLARS